MTLSRPTRWLAPTTVVVLAFIYVPLLVVVVNSFDTSVTFTWPPNRTDPRVVERAVDKQGVLATSVVLAAQASAVALVLGTLGALGLTRYDFFGREFLSLLVIQPIALPSIVIGLVLNALFTDFLARLRCLSLVVATRPSRSSWFSTTRPPG